MDVDPIMWNGIVHSNCFIMIEWTTCHYRGLYGPQREKTCPRAL